jgi:phosphate transport system substrate-binding protein
VKWFDGSLGAKGNAGVAGLIKQTPGTIGYVELVYAIENKLTFAQLQNKAGKFVDANETSVSAAAQGIQKQALVKEFKISLTDSAQKDAYPVSGFTWMLVYEKAAREKGQPIVKFAKWALGEEAQTVASSIHYAPVPKALRGEVVKKLDKVKFE